MNATLRMLEFNRELDTLIADGTDERTAGLIALAGLAADVAELAGVEPMVALDWIQQACREQQIVNWLRSQMSEPSF